MLEKGNRANTLHGILPVVRRLSFSPLIVGIVLGMLYANSLRNRLPETWVPGIRFCTKQVLRWGIVLYGFRLTLAQVAAVGVPAVVVDLIVVTVTILGGVLLVQNRHRRLHGRHFRNPLDVSLSGHVPHGHAQRDDRHGSGRLHGQHAARGGPRGRGGQRDGPHRCAGDRRNGHHHQDDPRHAARARARDHGLRAGGPPEGIRGRNGKTQDRRAVVRLRVHRDHRSQFAAAKPLRGGDGPGNSAQRDHRVR